MPSSERERPTLSRGNADRCPSCGRSDHVTLRQTNPGSRLEWFRCVTCDHMWAVERDDPATADERRLRLVEQFDRRQTADRRKFTRGDRRR